MRITIDIDIGRKATLKPDRIALHIPPTPRLVVPEVVVVRARFPVVLLPREPQVEREVRQTSRRLLVRRRIPERNFQNF